MKDLDCLCQAQACGIPVITSENTSQKEIAEDSVLYSMPSDIDKMAENILEIIDNKNNIKEKLIEKGFNNIKKFSWKECAEKTLEIFNL